MGSQETQEAATECGVQTWEGKFWCSYWGTGKMDLPKSFQGNFVYSIDLEANNEKQRHLSLVLQPRENIPLKHFQSWCRRETKNRLFNSPNQSFAYSRPKTPLNALRTKK